MQQNPFYFEIKDIVTQFVAAFDNVIIKRFNADRVPEQAVNVRYVYAPKSRVIYDIVNKQKNITLPAASVSITSISRDSTRVFNKIDGFYYSTGKGLDKTSEHLMMPVPIDIGISLSIIGKFQTDIEQIISNFIPYSNPYIIISWQIPQDLKLPYKQEIRSEVLWDGNILLSYPTDIAATDKYRITADTSFVIKGWLFKNKNSPSGNIFYIDSKFNAESAITDYESLSGNAYLCPPDNTSFYLQPDGESVYLQPDGESYYLQP
jgi:hypothetical protein